MKRIICFSFLLIAARSLAQDSSVTVGSKIITLSTVVIDNKLNVPAFINRIKNDTGFYKAFRNLRVINFNAINDIRMLDKKGGLNASLHSLTKQTIKDGCRTMEVIEENSSGDIYNDDRYFNYYTPEMYASLFFTTAL